MFNEQRTDICTSVAFLSENPDEQCRLHSSPSELKRRVLQVLHEQNVDCFVIFCNSMSFAIDWREVSGRLGKPVFELLAVYRRILSKYKSFTVFCADAVTLRRLEKFAQENGRGFSFCGICSVQAVNRIENGVDVTVLLRSIIDVGRGMRHDAVVLGCTHLESVWTSTECGLDVICPGKLTIADVLRWKSGGSQIQLDDITMGFALDSP